ncbi:MAG TPA: outer membrane beta-barrel protein [Ferruginibacter sp.]|jgi:hypothetical protein|nr:outer membrane beta-barrel protein [Ferruginibacter sp.]
MRKICICAGILLFSFVCITARAQIVVALLFGDKLNSGKMEFGLTVTPGFTSMTNESGEAKSSFNLGLYFNIRPDRKLFLHLELVGKGAFGQKNIIPYATGNDTLDHLFAEGSIERKIQVFSMPVLARYRLDKLFYAEAGMQVNMRLKVKDIFHAKPEGGDLDYTINATKNFTLLDFGVNAGLFYKFSDTKKSMGIGLRYFYGLTDVYKTKDGTQANTAFLINVTIPVGTSKAQK